jgi:hypothetical protein
MSDSVLRSVEETECGGLRVLGASNSVALAESDTLETLVDGIFAALFVTLVKVKLVGLIADDRDRDAKCASRRCALPEADGLGGDSSIDPAVDMDNVSVSHTMMAVVVDVCTALHGRFGVVLPAISMPHPPRVIFAAYKIVESLTRERENVGSEP